MRIRIVKVNEIEFLVSVKHGVWGSKKNRFKNWKIGDLLVFKIDDQLAAVGEISGRYFKSDDNVWSNGVFPYRVPINFIKILSEGNRVDVVGEVKKTLVNEWGKKYGVGLLNQASIEGEAAKHILQFFNNRENNININVYINLK
jgi:hypothetical protein